jgi:hypothetical protein
MLPHHDLGELAGRLRVRLFQRDDFVAKDLAPDQRLRLGLGSEAALGDQLVGRG